MKVLLEGYNFKINGFEKVFCEEINIPANTSMFTKKYIIEEILKAQKRDDENCLKREIIAPEPWEENFSKYEDVFGLVNMLDLCFHQDGLVIVKGKDANVDMVEITLRPETKEDFDIYFRDYLLNFYNVNLEHCKSHNFVLTLPIDEFIDANYISETTNYVAINIPCYTQYFNNRYYIIHKRSLSKPVIDIMARKDDIAHLIGKGGSHINEFKSFLNEGYNGNIKRINLLAYENL